RTDDARALPPDDLNANALCIDLKCAAPPIVAPVAPAVVPFVFGPGLDEIFHPHLLEFAIAKDEVSRDDLIAKRTADLRDAKRRLLAHRLLHVLEVYKDALCRFRTQIGRGRAVLHGTDTCAEQ